MKRELGDQYNRQPEDRPFAPNNHLLTPLGDQEKYNAQRSCVRTLEAWASGPFGNATELLSLEPIRLSVKSQTYRAHMKGTSVIVKRHAHQKNYTLELLALELLTQGASVPRLIGQLDRKKILVLEDLERSFRTDYIDQVCDVSRSLGQLHECAGLRPRMLLQLFPGFNLKSLLTNQQAETSGGKSARNLFTFLMGILGPEYVPFCLGDLKPEHLLDRKGQCVFVDLETFQLGVPEQFDILSLINLAPRRRLTSNEWRRVLSSYVTGRNAEEPYMSMSDLILSLRLAAKTFGFPRNLAP
jgi:hypothetical protein